MPNYNNQYLTLVAKGSGNFKFETKNNQTYSYSTNEGSTWVIGNSATTIAVNNGDRVMYKGTLTPNTSNGIGRFSSTTNFTVEGNAMSLLYGDNFIGQTSLSGKNYVFYRLFYGCSGLTSIENLKLPATTLANDCYEDMFYGCTSLTSIPSDLLLATSLASGCYEQMFSHCTSLTSIPSGLLLATTLANRCYGYMFANCTSLTSIPSGLLPATTLAFYCYGSMFMGCASLTTVPTNLLPATTLANNCYNVMFANCTSLTTAPNLPATTLSNDCYQYMFRGCTSLNEITCLATDISANGCTTNWVGNVADSGTFYKSPSMNDWTRSTSGIPVTWNVVDYYEPIYKWERITPVQGDPSTFICDECEVQYRWTATTGYECSGTTKMSREKKQQSEDGETWTDVIPMEYRAALPVIETYSSDCGYVPLERWVTVSGAYTCSGTTKMTQYKKQYSYDGGTTWVDSSPLVTKGDLPVIEYDSDDCGYTPYHRQYLTLVAKGSGYFQLSVRAQDFLYQYSTDGGNTWMYGNTSTLIPVVNGSRVMFKSGYCSHNRFSATTQFEVEGNIMSLLFGDNFADKTSLEGYSSYSFGVFHELFHDCTTLTSIQNLKLPATTLATGCYYQMFRGCTSLTSIPSGFLPATALASNCYSGMFWGCTSLTTLPSDLLPATTLATDCYYTMFNECSGLTTIPSGFLPATTLASECYCYMFSNCSHLTTIPSDLLPATTLVDNCYAVMFASCTSLRTAPILPAPTLAEECYQAMFRFCSSLNEITCYATDISKYHCTYQWIEGVASSGTFRCQSSTDWASKVDFNGIPNGWTRVDI